MKNILKYSKTSILLALILSFGRCDDLSELQSYGPPTSDQFWKTESDLQNAVNAIYMYSNYEEVGGRGHFWFENCSDNMVSGRNDNANANNIKNFISSANVGYIWEMWRRMYQLIAQTNSIILHAPDMTVVGDDAKNFALGQAYFFRGYGYLWLAPWFGDTRSGGIPIVKEDTPVDEIDVPRPASVLENYDMIIADLRKAADLLPSWSQLAPSDYGRPYKAAAWAFTARTALYAAQWDASYLDVVIEMCDKVIGLTGADKRDLLPDFTKLFTIENNFCSEYIFSILGNATSGPKFHGMSGQQNGWTINGKNINTWGYYQPTAELYEAYAVNDVRRDATILVPGQHIQWLGEDCHFGVNPEGISSTTQIMFRKFMCVYAPADAIGTILNTSGDNASNKLGTCVMRYADVLLMKAEALIWKNGEGDATAKGLLNQIRKRAGLLENSNATKAELKQERRLELAFEFLPSRHFDLVRWGDAQVTYAQPLHGYQRPAAEPPVDNETPEDKAAREARNAALYADFNQWNQIEAWASRTFDPIKNQVFAIPQTAINNAKNLAQNQGY
jgi:hypothetical protein